MEPGYNLTADAIAELDLEADKTARAALEREPGGLAGMVTVALEAVFQTAGADLAAYLLPGENGSMLLRRRALAKAYRRIIAEEIERRELERRGER